MPVSKIRKNIKAKDMMPLSNKNGYVYPTIEINSDGIELLHNGQKKMGFGRTNDPSRRFKEHASRGSKATVGVKFLDPIDCDEVKISDDELECQLHRKLENLGFTHIERISIFEKGNEEITSSTEVFSGSSKRYIPNIVSIGEELSTNLLLRIISNISNIDLFKNDLVLLPHQIDARKFIDDRFNAGAKEILLNHQARSGKSFIAYDYIIKNQPENVLLLTQYPILNGQWKTEFENLRGHGYNIIISNSVENIVFDKTKKNFIMIALQDAKGGHSDDEMVEGLKKQKFQEILKIKWNLIIFDEIHKGKETIKTDRLLSGLRYDRLIGLTATATKNILRGTFLPENIHRYLLTEENKYKSQYPELYKNPTMNHLLFHIDEDVKKEMDFFKKQEGFTFNKFFEVKDGSLVYKNDVIKLFSWFFCKGRYDKRTNSTFDVINKCQSTLLFVDNNECQSLIKDILIDLIGDVYDIHFTNSDVLSAQQLLEKINGSKRKSAEFNPKDGKKVVVIANKQLTTGVTMKYCDMVVFANDWKSIDEYIQACYRCRTPMDDKDQCYVIDLNPGRAYTILHEFIESNSTHKEEDINKSIKEYLNCAPIFENFGTELKKIDFEEFKNRVVQFSGIENKFFPNSVMSSNEEIFKEKERLMSLGQLESGSKESKNVKLDEDAPDSGKSKKVKRPKSDKVKESNDEYKNLMQKCLNNAHFFRERTSILSISTQFKYDNIDTIFGYLDTNEESKDEFLNNLLVDDIINETSANNKYIINRETLYQVISDIYKSKIFNKSALDFRVMIFNEKLKSLFKKYSCPSERMRNIDEVYSLIAKYLGISEIEKKKHGEVFTPFRLIREMLDKLPKNVWTNPNLKWLDPANGIGNFPAVIIERLMKGLEKWEPDEEKRYKHILENMIYVCDISPKNMFIYLNIFDPNNEYKMNFYKGSFIELGFDSYVKNIWKLKHFNIIIGNPPYNSNGTGTGNTIWHLFVEKSSKICDSYISFIHPSSWRMPLREGDRFYKSSQIIKNNIDYLNILRKEDSNNYFGLSIKVDYYLLNFNKKDISCKIEINNEVIEKNIKTLPFIPSYGFDLFYKLIGNKNDSLCEVIYSSKYDPRNDYISEMKVDKFIYPIVHTTPKKGTRYVYSSRNDLGHFGVKKVIFGDSGIYDVIIDMKGEYAMTQHAIGIKVDNIKEANLIKIALMSDKFHIFLESVMWSNFGIDRRLFSSLKKDFWKEFIEEKI